MEEIALAIASGMGVLRHGQCFGQVGCDIGRREQLPGNKAPAVSQEQTGGEHDSFMKSIYR